MNTVKKMTNESYKSTVNKNSGTNVKKNSTAQKKKNTNSKASANKTAGSKKGTTAASKKSADNVRARQKKVEEVYEYHDKRAFEITITVIVSSIVAVFMYLSYFGLGGAVGRVLGGLSFGVFGWCAWLIPFGAVFGYIFCLANRGNKLVKRKIISLVTSGLFLLGITDLIFKAEIITEYYSSNHVLHHNYFECMSMTFNDMITTGRGNAGLLGRAVSSIFVKITGEVGAIVIMLALFMLSSFVFCGVELMGRIRKRNAYRQEMETTYKEVRQQETYREPSYRMIKTSYSESGRSKIYKPVKISHNSPMQSVNLQAMNDYLDSFEKNVQGKENSVPKVKNNKKNVKPKEEDKKENLAVPDIDIEQVNIDDEKIQINNSESVENIAENKIEPEKVIEKKNYILDIPIYKNELEQKFRGKSKNESSSYPAYGIQETATYETDLVESSSFAARPETEKNEVYEEPVENMESENTESADSLDEFEIAGEQDFEEVFDDVHEPEENVEPEEMYEPEIIEEAVEEISYAEEVHVSQKPMDSFVHKEEVTDVTPMVQKVKQEKSLYKKPEETTNHGRIGGDNYVSQSETFNALNDSKTAAPAIKKEYIFPPVSLLAEPKKTSAGISDDDLRKTAAKLEQTLCSFKVKVRMGGVICGPTITRYELYPEKGVRVNKITNLADDIKLSLASPSVRIQAPIPGKSAVGIEVPNDKPSMVYFRELIESEEFKESKHTIAFAVGKDITGNTITTDIAKTPHLLIAGSTGSGKSVCINTLIMSILYKYNPDDVKLIMIDPKVVELSVYNGIPHLFCPVVTDAKEAAAALSWAVREMEDRYNKFSELGVRGIKGYNDKIKKVENPEKAGYAKMPYLVIIVDEFADLMMVASKDVENSVTRLAQLARAAGIHLVLATQRPSVNVITGIIKANIPSRIAFAVSSAIDSRTIIDSNGAEKLVGKGDMLFKPGDVNEPLRVQGAFVADEEVSDVVDFLKDNNENPEYNTAVTEITQTEENDSADNKASNNKPKRDEYFIEAGRFVIECERASAGVIQRKFGTGFNRAGRIIDQLCEAGVVGPSKGTKPREVIMSLSDFNAKFAGEDVDNMSGQLYEDEQYM